MTERIETETRHYLGLPGEVTLLLSKLCFRRPESFLSIVGTKKIETIDNFKILIQGKVKNTLALEF